MSYRIKTVSTVAMLGLALMARPAAAADAKIKPSADRRTISLELAKSEIRDALRLIAQSGNINLIIGPDIEGNVSVHLDNVPVEVALKSIAVNNNLRYAQEDGVVTITRMQPADANAPAPILVTRAFVLQAQDAARVKDAIEHVLSKDGKMTVLNENSDVSYITSTLNSLSGDMSSTSAGGGFSNNNGNATNGSVSAPSGVGGAQGEQQGASARNARTLVVTDIAEKINVVASLVADLDRLPPQVLIEARIVEMSTNLQRQLGIDWNIEALANGPILNHQLPLKWSAGFASGDQVQRTPAGTPYSTAGLSLGTVDLSRLSGMLRANQDDAAIRLLANPRMLIFNNHSANILVGERYPIFTANVSNFGTVTEAFQTYIPVGTQLEVTPTIMSDGRISLLVHPATSALGDDVVGTTGLRVARIQTREISTRVIMRDQQTIVLGGLISDRKIHVARKVPGLGDWPGISALFRQERPQTERVDLLVFLTAQIDGATKISDRDRKVFDMYKPHFKQVERLQDVPLHFEIPTEYEPPKPRFTDPPVETANTTKPGCTDCNVESNGDAIDMSPNADSDQLTPLSSTMSRSPVPTVRKVNMRADDRTSPASSRATPPRPVFAPSPAEETEGFASQVEALLGRPLTNHESARDIPMNQHQGVSHESSVRPIGGPRNAAPKSNDVRANQPRSINDLSMSMEAAPNAAGHSRTGADAREPIRPDVVQPTELPVGALEKAPRRSPALPGRVRRVCAVDGGLPAN